MAAKPKAAVLDLPDPDATPAAVPPEAAEEETLYAPPQDRIEVAGETFQIAPMSLHLGFRFQRLVARYMAHLGAPLQWLSTVPEESRLATLALFDWAGMLGEDGYAELLAIALSSPEREVDATWVQEHYEFGWTFDALEAWGRVNKDGLGKAGAKILKLLANVAPALTALTQVMRNGSASPTSSTSS